MHESGIVSFVAVNDLRTEYEEERRGMFPIVAAVGIDAHQPWILARGGFHRAGAPVAIEVPGQGLTRLASVSGDEQHVALVYPDGNSQGLCVVSLSDKSVKWKAALEKPARSVGFSANGETVFAVIGSPSDKQCTLALFSFGDGKPRTSMEGLESPVAFSDDLRRALEMGDSGEVFVRDLSTGSRSPQPVLKRGGLRELVWCPDNIHFVFIANQPVVEFGSCEPAAAPAK
jgi:hypothetical protein